MSGLVASVLNEMTAQAPAEPVSTEKVDTAIPVTSNAEPPLSKYAEIKGKPYTAEYLDIDFWEALTPQLDVEGIGKNVGMIEEYVAKEIGNRNLEDTLDSYREIMGEVKSFLNMSPNEKAEGRIDRYANYINLKNRQAKEDVRHEKMMKRILKESEHGNISS